MNRLSKFGIKIVLPILLIGINSTNWRTRIASIDALSSVTFMATK